MALGKDKIIHATVCCVTTIGMSLITAFFGKAVSLVSGTVFSLGLGLGKECGDFFNPNSKWDWKDLIADIVGTAIGLSLSPSLDGSFSNGKKSTLYFDNLACQCVN